MYLQLKREIGWVGIARLENWKIRKSIPFGHRLSLAVTNASKHSKLKTEVPIRENKNWRT
ncbi:hypothetical protein SAMN04489723_104136 [Algoriphagus aquimarinus]|uniref:Uncharacterized protein n=1 Tax=Algoriphagus aquimarinus TaxID=237018 RepID=A0A1I0Y643_9BACT|nr:hypothetical protein SAMN04489723_104136 [Algoriphagus aquimarinus]